MAEIVSAKVTGANGQPAGYAYFHRYTGKSYGTGREEINSNRPLGADGRPSGVSAGRVRSTINSVAARQASRRPRVLRAR